ncbi:MAG: transposase [Limnochordaceae bacterium]|nr:transposase [Limnochordaceae bacterium]
MVSLEELVPPNYILRRIDAAVDFSFIRQQVADKYDATWGRPSIDPELTLRLYTLAYLFNLSERGVCRETQMHAGFRWFCRLDFHDPVPDHSTLVKTRKLWGRETFKAVLRHVVAQCIEAGLVDGRKVGVDGTQVQANAAITSLEPLPQPIPLERYIRERLEPEETTEPAAPDPPPSPLPRKAGDPDFHGQRFSNATHRSKTDPDARLYCKGEHQEAKLRYLVHNLVDWKSRVILDTDATRAEGHAEVQAALQMVEEPQALPLPHGIDELQADKGYAPKGFFAALLERGIRPRVVLPRSQDHPVPIPIWHRSTRELATYRKRKQKVQEALAHNAVWALQSSQTRRMAERQREICEWRLHDWAAQNLDESMFAPLFDARTGGPSVSPVHTFLALLIQMEKGYSDREMEQESRFDDRVKLAILAGRDFEGIDAVTLCDHRRRFLQHGIATAMLERTLASAKKAGLFSPERSQIVDSFLIHGGAAVQDTYTLIRKAVVRVLAVAWMHELDARLSAVLKRTD